MKTKNLVLLFIFFMAPSVAFAEGVVTGSDNVIEKLCDTQQCREAKEQQARAEEERQAAKRLAAKNQTTQITQTNPDTSQQDLKKDASDAMGSLPALGSVLGNVVENADGGGIEPTGSAITATAEAASKTLTGDVGSAISGAVPTLQQEGPAGSSPFLATVGEFEKIKTAVNKYVAAEKKSCTTFAEKTEFLCVEGTSPGIKATKLLIDAAGPVLAVMNSVQKTCSSTSKVTGLASAALTAAKGVCVAAKMMCDSKCAKAMADIQKTMTSAQKDIESALDKDGKDSIEMCQINAFKKGDPETQKAYFAACQAATQKKHAEGLAAGKKILSALQEEIPPQTPGTSSSLALKCDQKLRDIALLAANIAGLLAAKKGADECDKKTAAAGEAGTKVTALQYCEMPANTNTQFCKCQANQQQEGCAGGLLNLANESKDNTTDVAGVNLKTGSGLSSFAGGKSAALSPNNALDGMSAGSLSENGTSTLGASDGDSSSGGTPGATEGSGVSSGSAADSVKADPAEDKKKWGFGAFASSLGGMFGGGNNSKNSGNGNLNAKQQDAIKRKIASDKLSGEITSASGKSNWEKVHQTYLIKENTLLPGR